MALTTILLHINNGWLWKKKNSTTKSRNCLRLWMGRFSANCQWMSGSGCGGSCSIWRIILMYSTNVLIIFNREVLR